MREYKDKRQLHVPVADILCSSRFMFKNCLTPLTVLISEIPEYCRPRFFRVQKVTLVDAFVYSNPKVNREIQRHSEKLNKMLPFLWEPD